MGDFGIGSAGDGILDVAQGQLGPWGWIVAVSQAEAAPQAPLGFQLRIESSVAAELAALKEQ